MTKRFLPREKVKNFADAQATIRLICLKTKGFYPFGLYSLSNYGEKSQDNVFLVLDCNNEAITLMSRPERYAIPVVKTQAIQ